MPHQCVRCNTFYEDGADQILKGCPCGARLFFFVKAAKLEEARKKADALKLIAKREKYQTKLCNLREKYVFHFGNSSKIGADYILSKMA